METAESHITQKSLLSVSLLIGVMAVVLVALVGYLGYLVWGGGVRVQTVQEVSLQEGQPGNAGSATGVSSDGLSGQVENTLTAQLRTNSRIPEAVVPQLHILDSGEDIPLLSSETVANYVPVNPVRGYGEYQYPYDVTEPQDPFYQKYQPQNITFAYDSAQSVVVMTWQDSAVEPKPYMWAVGYWYEPFDPIEKSSLDLQGNEPIAWRTIESTDPQFNQPGKQLLLDLSAAPDNLKNLYITIFVKTKFREDLYVDYLYGEGDAMNLYKVAL